jgi:hypothetical protein
VTDPDTMPPSIAVMAAIETLDDADAALRVFAPEVASAVRTLVATVKTTSGTLAGIRALCDVAERAGLTSLTIGSVRDAAVTR